MVLVPLMHRPNDRLGARTARVVIQPEHVHVNYLYINDYMRVHVLIDSYIFVLFFPCN